MGHHTRKVTHVIKNTEGLCLLEEQRGFTSMMTSLSNHISHFSRIFAVRMERGKNLEVDCWEDVWTSGM